MQRNMRLWKVRCQPLLALDFHSPGGCETDGVYSYLPGNTEDFALLHQWSDRLQQQLGEYAAPNFGRIVNYRSRWETPTYTRFCLETLEAPAFSLETPYGRINDTVLQARRLPAHRRPFSRGNHAWHAGIGSVCKINTPQKNANSTKSYFFEFSAFFCG